MKIFYYSLMASLLGLAACKKDKDNDNETGRQPFQVNLYQPSSPEAEHDVPQITIKTEQFQFTALGDNQNGIQQRINKIYLSDTDNKTEWIVMLNEERKPVFMYGINTATKVKEPNLYWLEKVSASSSILRYYNYDWENRLGTLQYELETSNGQTTVLFENSNPSALLKSSQSQAMGKKPGKQPRSTSFAAPVAAFDRFSAVHFNQENFTAAGSNDPDETPEEAFDRQTKEFLTALQDIKNDMLNSLCAINILSAANGQGCLLTELIKKVTDKEIFADAQQALHQQGQQQDPQQPTVYEGENSTLDLGIFHRLSGWRDNMQRHLNDVHHSLQNLDFPHWLENLFETTNTELVELDDLTDSRGVIQIGLSWNTATDIDLHVTDPFGEKIWYNNESSQSGGYLDRDDTDGFGPENIYWGNNAPIGTYTIMVHYYGGNEETGATPATNYTVRLINGLGFSKTFTGTLLREDDSNIVARFTKSGNTITLQ